MTDDRPDMALLEEIAREEEADRLRAASTPAAVALANAIEKVPGA